jgi:pimeloyl-ACP methyl ester carboxylesterase
MRWYFTGLTGSWTIYAAQKEAVSRSDTGFLCDQAFADTYHFPALKERNRIALEEVVRRHGEVSLLGVSEGGDIAAELAQIQPAVRRLAVIGSGGLPFRAVGRLLDARQGGITFERTFAHVDADPTNTAQKALGYSHLYWSSVLDRDPWPVYLSLRMPILMIHGEQDDSVPVEAARALEHRFAATGRTNFKLVVVPGASHVLTVGGVNRKPEIMDLIATFFTRGTS